MSLAAAIRSTSARRSGVTLAMASSSRSRSGSLSLGAATKNSLGRPLST
jgi:hypothetical protein